MQSDVIVTVCVPEEVPIARRLLMSDSLDREDSSYSVDAAVAEADARNILIATVGGQLRGAIYYQLGSGRVGWMWAPMTAANTTASLQNSEIYRRLVLAGIALLSIDGARLIQVLLKPGDRRAEVLEACGFRPLTEIVQMERIMDDKISVASALPHLDFVSCAEKLEQELRDIVEQTYTNTLDCPELDGVRPVAEVLEGYRAAGEFRGALWSLARHEGQFVGCVLVSFFPESRASALQYMGVIPSCRRRGIGRQLAWHAIRVARGTGAQSLSLAVDIRNSYARRLYESVGFQETERRTVFIIRVDSGALGRELSTIER